jgi:hypothetical protein
MRNVFGGLATREFARLNESVENFHGKWANTLSSAVDKASGFASNVKNFAAGVANQLSQMSAAAQKHLGDAGDAAEKAGKKHKQAADEVFKAVQDWLKATGQVEISKTVWDRLAQSVKDSFNAQQKEFHANQDALQTYRANIMATMLNLGYEVIKANNETGISFKKAGDTIQVEGARVEASGGFWIRFANTVRNSLQSALTSVRGITDGVGPAFDQLQVDSAKATAALIADSQKRVENYNAEQKAADDSFRSLAAHVESMGHDIPEGLRKITDGFVMMSGKTGEAMLLMLQKVRGWGHDVVQVIETLPGKFGDAARGILKTVDQWIVFFDRVLQLAHRFSSSFPESVEMAISKIVGLFKGAQSQIQVSTTGILDSLGSIIKNIGGLPVATNKPGFVDPLGLIPDLSKAAASVAGDATKAGAAIGSNITSGIGSFLSSGLASWPP